MSLTKHQMEEMEGYRETVKDILFDCGFLKECFFAIHIGSTVDSDDPTVYAVVTDKYKQLYPSDHDYKRLHAEIKSLLNEYPFRVEDVCDCEERFD